MPLTHLYSVCLPGARLIPDLEEDRERAGSPSSSRLTAQGLDKAAAQTSCSNTRHVKRVPLTQQVLTEHASGPGIKSRARPFLTPQSCLFESGPGKKKAVMLQNCTCCW